ncbi:MMPL family transporter [Jonesia quinghaiensis]|uniref:MMPL family transporter n=1 Tax=Jonesia quinghaiensis TaxID=262806 RepID=UPI00042090A5|nr:MMPL family transporter [Jonesia quinghaiensis]
MSTALYNLGRTLSRHRLATIGAWLLIIVLSVAAAVFSGGKFNDNLSIPGTEAQEGLDVLSERFPQVAGASGQLLLTAPAGQDIRDFESQITSIVDDASQIEDVAVISNPFDEGGETAFSPSNEAALLQIQLDTQLGSISEQTLDGFTDLAQEINDTTPLEANVGGGMFTMTTVHFSIVEVIGVGVALLVLTITFGSLVAAGVPIITAIIGVAVSMLLVVTAGAFTDVSSTTPTLAIMLGLAVGIDYALFIISRHRSQLAEGLEVQESIARAQATAGSAVIFAGITVIIALSGLAVAGIPFLTVMGLAAAAAVAIAVLVALTLLPAVLSLLGERLRPRKRVVPGAPKKTARWVTVVTRKPWLTVVTCVALLGIAAIPVKDMALALMDSGSQPVGTAVRDTYDLIAEQYGEGYNAPILVTADIIASDDPLGVVADLAQDIEQIDGVVSIAVATPNMTADLGMIQLVPQWGQTDPRTADLVHDIREQAATWENDLGVSNMMVTGQVAAGIDISEKLSDALLPFGAVVVGLSLVLLLVVFRSIAVPLKATVGYLLSVMASFGVTWAVFGYGWGASLLNVDTTGPVISFMPIIVMGVLFGLAMDYEVFLVSRIREEYVHTGNAQQSILTGYTESARVVSAAAIIMIAVFGSFVPTGDAIIKPLAFALAIGVFIDAFIVRMTLVPAVLAILGDRAWWLPRWLERSMPQLDVEGTGLEKRLSQDAWAQDNPGVVIRAEDVTVHDTTDRPLLSGFTLTATPGDVVLLHSTDPSVRQGVLAALTGRHRIESGTVTVADCVQPEERSKLRRSTAFHTQVNTLDDVRRVTKNLMNDPHSAAVVALDTGMLLVTTGTDTTLDAGTLDALYQHLAPLHEHGIVTLIGTSANADASLTVTPLVTRRLAGSAL